MTESNQPDAWKEGRDEHFMDIDRMVNEGLGGGQVTLHNGLIEESLTHTMFHPESLEDEMQNAADTEVQE